LLREHRGKVALVHGNEVVGVFKDANEAIVEGIQRFGWARLVCRVIEEPEGPVYFPHVDVNHPSFQRLDEQPAADHGKV
jgi:hypothetical protein